MQNDDQNPAPARLLVRADGRRGFSAHIADASGQPLCDNALNLSRWKVEERSVTEAKLCWRCARRAKKDRS